jgi:hypothetical protein
VGPGGPLCANDGINKILIYKQTLIKTRRRYVGCRWQGIHAKALDEIYWSTTSDCGLNIKKYQKLENQQWLCGSTIYVERPEQQITCNCEKLSFAEWDLVSTGPHLKHLAITVPAYCCYSGFRVTFRVCFRDLPEHPPNQAIHLPAKFVSPRLPPPTQPARLPSPPTTWPASLVSICPIWAPNYPICPFCRPGFLTIWAPFGDLYPIRAPLFNICALLAYLGA